MLWTFTKCQHATNADVKSVHEKMQDTVLTRRKIRTREMKQWKSIYFFMFKDNNLEL